MKRLFNLFVLASILIAGCTKEYTETDTEVPREDLKPMTFSASVPESKASIDIDRNINWSEGDKIGIFDGAFFREFTLKSGAGTTSAVFEGEAAKADSYIAVYPYNENLAIDSEGKIHGLSVPRVQDAGACPVIMTAECKDGGNAFAFKNALAYVKVTSIFPCNKIVLDARGKDEADLGRDLCGDVELVSGSAHVIANPDNHVILNGDIEAGRPYYIAVAPRCLSKGFMVVFDSSGDDGLQYSKTSEEHPELQRGHVLNLGAFNKTPNDYWTSISHLAPNYQHNDWPNLEHHYAIYDWRDVTRIGECCTNDEKSTVRFLFMADIDFGGRILGPMVLNSPDRYVYIHGFNHKITNYFQGGANVDGDGCLGMFVVKNLQGIFFYDLSLYPNVSESSLKFKNDVYGGAFVARCHCNNHLHFQNCKANAKISVTCTGNNQAYAGGFVGMADLPGETDGILGDPWFNMYNCLMEGSVTACSEEDIAYAGGFFGFINAPEGDYLVSLARSRNRAVILAEGDDDSTTGLFAMDGISAGGIVGCDHDTPLTPFSDGNVVLRLNSCVNEGSVTAHSKDNDNAFAGGMIGCHDSDGSHGKGYGYEYNYDPYLSNCFNMGTITAISTDSDDNAAGMVGYCYNDNTSFSNCVDSGNLSGNVCAHISGTKGSYSGICYWTTADSLPGIHDKDKDYGPYRPERMSGYKTDLAVTDLHPAEGEAGWIMRDGHLDLDIIR